MSKKSRARRAGLQEGSRAFRRSVANPHSIKNVMTAFREYIDEKAADRPGYIKLFFDMWDEAAEVVDKAAEVVLKHQHIMVHEGDWETLLAPYSLCQIIFFTRLMDHLEPDEEARFALAQERCSAAWQKFFSTILVRHPELEELVERMAENRRIVHDELVELYTGEALPALTPRCVRAHTALEKDCQPLAEGLLK